MGDHIGGWIRSHLSAVVLSGGAQLVSSATSFLVAAYVVRVATKAEFGVYTAALGAVIVVAGLVTSFLGVPFLVNASTGSPGAQASLAARHIVATAAIGVVLLVVFGGAFPSLLFWQPAAGAWLWIGLATLLSAAFFALRDMAARAAHSVGREQLVLLGSIVTSATTLLLFLGDSLAFAGVSAFRATLYYGLSQLAGSAIILVFLRVPVFAVRCRDIWLTLVECRRGGGTTMLTSAAYYLRNQAHSFLILPLFGASTLADVNAARVLVTPAMLAIHPITQVLTPRLARLRDVGVERLKVPAIAAAGSLVVLAAGYSILLLAFAKWLVPLALGSAYGGIGNNIAVWCIITTGLALQAGVGMTFQVVGDFARLLRVNVAAAALVAILGLLAALGGRVSLVIESRALVEVGVCLWLLSGFQRALFDQGRSKKTRAGSLR